MKTTWATPPKNWTEKIDRLKGVLDSARIAAWNADRREKPTDEERKFCADWCRTARQDLLDACAAAGTATDATDADRAYALHHITHIDDPIVVEVVK